MPANVPYRRVGVEASDVQVGASVRGLTWRNAAELAHWSRGRGQTIVPASWSGLRISSASGSTVLHYKVRPSPYAIARVWSFAMHSTGSTSGDLDLKVGTNPTRNYVVPPWVWPSGRPILYIEELSSKVTAATDTQVTLLANTTDIIQVDHVTCYEIPRFALNEDATELGVDLESLFAQSSIHDTANASAHAVAELVDALWARRNHVASFTREWSTTSTTYAAVHTHPIPVLAPYTGSATATLNWDLWASMSGAGNSGTVRVTTASGNTSTITLTADASAYAYYGPATVTIDTEDPATDDGWRGGTEETLTVEAKVDSGGGSIRLQAFSAWD